MKIAVNTRLLIKDKLEGLGSFTNETLKLITRWHPEHEFIFIFDRKYSDEFIYNNNVKPVITKPPARHPVLWYIFFEWGVPAVLKKYNADIFLSPDGWLSLNSNIPSLAVIHDLNFFHNPNWVSRIPRYYYNYYFPRFIHKADRIASVSEYSKKDICNRFKVDPGKIDVVYNGVKEKYQPALEEEKSRIRKIYTSGVPYFLFLGLVHPRKNLGNIIKSYEVFRNKTSENVKLVVAGSTKFWDEETRATYENSTYRSDILLLGRVADEELGIIISAAKALVYASLFEGFGIPILEAMQCNTPVITSTVTSMPEVGGDAVCYCDPYSVESISDAMLRVFSDEEYSRSLVMKGKEQLKKFSWEKTAQALWNSIEKLK
ncbi:MAG: glycosyltransferase family 4 protein [Bacteroidales bacterium]|nr:glycosyltransferase family 4 protein [Bacteroidales bacterium]